MINNPIRVHRPLGSGILQEAPLVIAALLDAGADQKAQADFNETVWSITMRNPDWVGHLFYGLLRTLEWQ